MPWYVVSIMMKWIDIFTKLIMVNCTRLNEKYGSSMSRLSFRQNIVTSDALGATEEKTQFSMRQETIDTSHRLHFCFFFEMSQSFQCV